MAVNVTPNTHYVTLNLIQDPPEMLNPVQHDVVSSA